MTRRKLLAAIDSNRDDLDAYRVYADWLTEQGDPWGQVIAIQHALKTLGETAPRDELEVEETRLLHEHRGRLWGALADESELVAATWHCGFLDTIGIHHAPARAIARILPALAKLEIARHVRAIDLHTDQWSRDACDALAAQAWPSVERLALRGYSARVDARWVVSSLDAMLALRELCVEHSHSTDGLCRELALHAVGDRLTSLSLFDGQFTSAGIAALSSGPFSKLGKLVVTGEGPANARSMLARTARDLTVDLRE